MRAGKAGNREATGGGSLAVARVQPPRLMLEDGGDRQESSAQAIARKRELARAEHDELRERRIHRDWLKALRAAQGIPFTEQLTRPRRVPDARDRGFWGR